MIKKNTKLRVLTSLTLLALVFFMIKFNFILAYVLIVLGTLSIIEFTQITKKIFQKRIYKYISNIFFIIYLSLLCFFFFFFSNFIHMKAILFILVFGCIASDIGGFVVGRLFKGPRLTKISPNKTYAGAFGSIMFTCLTITLTVFILSNVFSYLILFVSIFTSVSCQIGDLLFSYLKRKARIKDTGSFLPGHGGILDRLDGMLLGVPLGLVSIMIFI